MSSHHVVRDGQEPALFIMDAIPFHMVEPLLEWVPMIMVVDNALEAVLTWGIKIDAVLQHQYAWSELEQNVVDQQPVRLLPAEENGVIQGLQYLVAEEYTAVNIICARPEDVITIVENARLPIQVGVYSDKEKWFLVSSGNFEKWMPTGTQLKIRCLQNTSLQTEGVIQKDGCYETTGAGMVSIRSTNPLWIGENFS